MGDDLLGARALRSKPPLGNCLSPGPASSNRSLFVVPFSPSPCPSFPSPSHVDFLLGPFSQRVPTMSDHSSPPPDSFSNGNNHHHQQEPSLENPHENHQEPFVQDASPAAAPLPSSAAPTAAAPAATGGLSAGQIARKKLMGYVGFANLPNQVHRKRCVFDLGTRDQGGGGEGECMQTRFGKGS